MLKQKENIFLNKIISFVKHLFVNKRFFYVLIGNFFLFIIAFIYPKLLLLSQFCLAATIIFLIIDILTLNFSKNGIEAKRIVPERFSNGDENTIQIEIKNQYTISVFATIIDELPFQFQARDFSILKKLKPEEQQILKYNLQPTERGEYHFGNLHVYVKTAIGFASKRFTIENSTMVKTYPSFLQLKKYDLTAINHLSHYYGIKKTRRISNSSEFEQIKEYVQGDTIKDINWKATAKRNQLMVNQFQDEKAQQVYFIIDKGRVMKMPFNNLSLLDYAINSALIMSNVVLKKQDKAGVFSFSKKIDNYVVAERRNSQMNLILESLYNITTDFFESDYSTLYASIKRNITQRSLLLLYTNFESLDAVHRQMNYLRAINKSHLLVVVFFQNTELENLSKQTTKNTQEVFDKTIAEKFMYDKKLIVTELKKYGIHTILTAPEDLTINSINKYLEIKAKGLL